MTAKQKQMVHCAVDSMLSHDSLFLGNMRLDYPIWMRIANRVGKHDAAARFVTPSERNIVVQSFSTARAAF